MVLKPGELMVEDVLPALICEAAEYMSSSRTPAAVTMGLILLGVVVVESLSRVREVIIADTLAAPTCDIGNDVDRMCRLFSVLRDKKDVVLGEVLPAIDGLIWLLLLIVEENGPVEDPWIVVNGRACPGVLIVLNECDSKKAELLVLTAWSN